MQIYTITLKHNRVWQGVSVSLEQAKQIACDCYHAPLSSVIKSSVKVIK